jgi:hypothetical protein
MRVENNNIIDDNKSMVWIGWAGLYFKLIEAWYSRPLKLRAPGKSGIF